METYDKDKHLLMALVKTDILQIYSISQLKTKLKYERKHKKKRK